MGYFVVFLFVSCGVFNLIMAKFIETQTTVAHRRKLRELGESHERMKCELVEYFGMLFERDVPGFSLSASSKPRGTRMSNRISDTLADLNLSWGAHEDPADRARRILKETGTQNVGVTPDMFNSWLSEPELLDLLDELQVETAAKNELFDVVDVDMDGEVTLNEVVSGIMRLRGAVTKTDIVAIRMKVRNLTSYIHEIHAALTTGFCANH